MCLKSKGKKPTIQKRKLYHLYNVYSQTLMEGCSSMSAHTLFFSAYKSMFGSIFEYLLLLLLV